MQANEGNLVRTYLFQKRYAYLGCYISLKAMETIPFSSIQINRLLLWGILLIPMLLHAETPSHLVVHQTDGSQSNYALEQNIRIECDEHNITIRVANQKAEVIPYEKVKRLTFEEASSAMENEQTKICNVYVANQTIKIQSTKTILGVQVWNLQGQLVYTLPFDIHGLHVTLPATWDKGVYIVGIETMAGDSAHKIILP